MLLNMHLVHIHMVSTYVMEFGTYLYMFIS